jgi:hypothetical protein
MVEILEWKVKSCVADVESAGIRDVHEQKRRNWYNVKFLKEMCEKGKYIILHMDFKTFTYKYKYIPDSIKPFI